MMQIESEHEYERDYDANKACCSKTAPLFESDKLVNKRSIVFLLYNSSSDNESEKKVIKKLI